MTGAESLQLFMELVANGNELFLSDEDFVVINGVTKPTLKKIYAEFLASIGSYPTVADGIANTSGTGTNNRFFTVPESGDTAERRYRNDAGVAVLVNRISSADVVDGLVAKFVTADAAGLNVVPVVVTQDGKVPIWLENGLLSAANLSPALRLAATADIIARSDAASALMLPMISNDRGQVVAWLENGSFNAAGLDQRIQEAIGTETKRKYSDASQLYSYRAQLAKAKSGSGFARVFFTGDSWTEHLLETPQVLATSLYEAFGQSGQGWISVHADEGGASSTLSQLLNGARLNKSSGWTLADMTLAADGLDGHAVTATGATATINITNLKTQALRWYYLDSDGAFRYTVDGGTPVVVAGGGTGTRKSIDIDGLADSAHTIRFDLVGNAGTVTMYGGFATRTASGIEFSKAGNGGSTAVQWNGIAVNTQAYAAELKPDLVFIILGTNDRNRAITKAEFKAGIISMVAAYREGSPNCAVVLVTPVAGGDSPELGLMSSYAEAMDEVSRSIKGVEQINLNEFMPPRSVSDALGLWKDENHLSELGGRFVADLLMKYFLSF
ncbi:SGNH/GDSL hydrolase family protein [Pseudomonas putida]|uniref:SGNH/GDSL hydrolase family protein n=1 Tax=Pseudomonas putida TaxID=303 RepID=UPI0021676348|nr:SGNH/GDSL hydrolase family protein [Pseudomonas putida]MCS4063729.1 lysophospholipase L1-like esterase [Pseudomonas putida]